jgi:sulfur carrier protein
MSLEIKFSENHIENMDISSLTVEELLKNLDIDPLEVIVKKDDRVILVDEIIKNKDNIQIIRVIHGG